MISEDLYNLSYDTYLIEQSYNQDVIVSYLAENSVINEGLIDGAKGLVEKLINAIKKLYVIFFERMNELFISNKKYLEKYRNIIRNKPPKDREYTMTVYDQSILSAEIKPFETAMNGIGMSDIINFTSGINSNSGDIDEFADDNFKGKEQSHYELELIKDMFPKIKCSDSSDFRSDIKESAADEDVEKNASELNMGLLMEECIEFDKTVDRIKKQFDSLSKSESFLLKIFANIEHGSRTYNDKFKSKKEKDDKAKAATQSQNNAGQQSTNP